MTKKYVALLSKQILTCQSQLLQLHLTLDHDDNDQNNANTDACGDDKDDDIQNANSEKDCDDVHDQSVETGDHEHGGNYEDYTLSQNPSGLH